MMNPLLSRLVLALFLLAPVLAVPGPGPVGVARPAHAVAKLGFTKRQDGWIGGSALHASGCPKDLQDCGNSKAQNWCCPKDTVCKSDYCCPTDSACGTIVKTFPSCADPTWTLCSWDYYFGPEYYCCRPGEQCYMAVGGNAPACGPGNLPVQSSQLVSTVSPLITRSVSGGPSIVPAITRGSSGSGSGSPTAGGSQKPTDPADPAASSSSSGLSGGAIGGIVAGVIAGLSLIAIVGVLGARYGSKRAIQNYVPGGQPAAPPPPPPGYAPEPVYAWKPEEQQQQQQQMQQQQQQQQQQNQNQGYRPPGPHVELGTEGR